MEQQVDSCKFIFFLTVVFLAASVTWRW